MPKDGRKARPLTVRLDRKTCLAVRRLRVDRGISTSDVLREAVAFYLRHAAAAASELARLETQLQAEGAPPA